MLESLACEALTTGELISRFEGELVRTAVMKHLDVLEAAGLIRFNRQGRTRLNEINRQPLVAVSRWLDSRVTQHRENLGRLKRLAESDSLSD